MPRAYLDQDTSTSSRRDPAAGEWQALRGELVALLDQVEDRYAPAERGDPAMGGLAERVRSLRDQVGGQEPAVRRQEALRTVKKAVDRFSERDTLADDHGDSLTRAISEIRSRQMSAPGAAVGRRASEHTEFRELTTLVTGLSGRLERLEGELKSQRDDGGHVAEVANQVEQLTHVVELLAGAVGETGQVKRLEAQIAALGAMIEDGPKVDLSAVNKRLDDVTATVGKLAELQAQQMEREVVREERKSDTEAGAVRATHSIEKSVRSIYDRIDAMERNVALSATDFDRLTAEMASFTQAMKDRELTPSKLVAKVDALAARIGDLDSKTGDVAGLKNDLVDLRLAVLEGLEPRFRQIENRLEAIAARPEPDTSKVEGQLHQLMARMEEAGAQLDNLTRLYSSPTQGPDAAEIEAMATLVAERTGEAITRNAPAPVAVVAPEALKSIEDQITGLVRSASRAPDYDKIATMLAQKTSEAIARTAPAAPAAAPGLSEDNISALEERMTALLNTAGRETADRLARLEAVLSEQDRKETQRSMAASQSKPAAPAESRPRATVQPAAAEGPDAMLFALTRRSTDAMPMNPADDAPLVDVGFEPPAAPLQPRPAAEAPQATDPVPPVKAAAPEPAVGDGPVFDPEAVDRPPRPISSFEDDESDPFAEAEAARRAAAPAEVAPPVSVSSTSTFVAAARRAQQARQDGPAAEAGGESLLGRAFSRLRPNGTRVPADEPVAAEPKAEKPAKPAKPTKAEKADRAARAAAEVKPARKPAMAAAAPSVEEAMPAADPGFLARNRRALLLGAALVAVSMLALNLVMERTDETVSFDPAPTVDPAPASTEPVTPAEEPVTPAAEPERVSATRPVPRVIDMVDSGATGAINPADTVVPRAEIVATPMPRSLLATAAGSATERAERDAAPAEPETTGSVPDTVAVTPAAPETFELPPEAVGPEPLRQAAAAGDARAQFEIGAIYSEGRALDQDFAEAAKWYERAAAQGFAPAQYRLGNLYEVGQGVDKDLEVARLWYQRSAESGNRMAMHNLAALHAGGELGGQDFESAAEWFTKAASLGMTDSQFNLGMLYARGLGLDQDFEQSYKWFSLAARSGDADAGKARDDIAKSLSAEAVKRIDAELETWTASEVDLASNFAPIGTWAEEFDPGEPIKAPDVIARVQEALGRLGFDVGEADGVAGSKTANAIKAFERGTGMSEKGEINPRLLAVLGSQPV